MQYVDVNTDFLFCFHVYACIFNVQYFVFVSQETESNTSADVFATTAQSMSDERVSYNWKPLKLTEVKGQKNSLTGTKKNPQKI